MSSPGNYGKLSDPAAQESLDPRTDGDRGGRRKSRRRTAISVSASLAILVLISVTVGVTVVSKRSKHKDRDGDWSRASRLIDSACSRTLYPDLCVSTLMSYPGALQAKTKELAHISLRVTMDRVQKAYGLSANLIGRAMDFKERVAFQDCLELLEDTVDQLNVSLTEMLSLNTRTMKRQSADVQTWLSAALTNQDTCLDGFQRLKDGDVKTEMESMSQNLSELVSNSLAIFKVSTSWLSAVNGAIDGDFPVPAAATSGGPNNRRLLSDDERLDGDDQFYSNYGFREDDFPSWLSAGDRRLLQVTDPAAIQADLVVAKDGTGNYKTIQEAVKAAPEKSNTRFVIYVKAGIYYENVTVSKKKTNLMFVGDGKGRTIVAAARNVRDGLTTFRSATFAVAGKGFIARDMTFENTAGPEKHQAVALRVGGDHSVVYRCNFIGYQDTLYVHSHRQYYRECDIYGTVDFIFGNAAVVFQNCNIFARKPMANQKNTITAQSRKDPNQNTGISIHNCRVGATIDLVPLKASIPTYLGRPWKMYSRTVYMQSFLDDLIDPAGWLEWSGDFALKTLYYGEYMNYGPGAAIGKRVRWPGYRVITAHDEANKFTVAQFISGTTWLPSTGIAFVAGLLE